MPPQKKTCYQPVKDFTSWNVSASFNNWNIIKFSHKETSSEDIDEIYQVVLYGIRDNMSVLIQTSQYVAINTTYTTTVGYYVIKFLSEVYKI